MAPTAEAGGACCAAASPPQFPPCARGFAAKPQTEGAGRSCPLCGQAAKPPKCASLRSAPRAFQISRSAARFSGRRLLCGGGKAAAISAMRQRRCNFRPAPKAQGGLRRKKRRFLRRSFALIAIQLIALITQAQNLCSPITFITGLE